MEDYLNVVTDEEIGQVMGDVQVINESMEVINELCHLYELHRSDGNGIPLASYHNLLANGDYEKVKQILRLLPSQEIKKFVLNTLISYDNVEALENKHIKKK